MSEHGEGIDRTCCYCENYGRRDEKTGVCFDVSPLRFLLFGPRKVLPNSTCPKFWPHLKYGGRSR